MQEIIAALESCTEVHRHRFFLYALNGLSYSKNGIENDAIGWEQPSPEDIRIQKEDELLNEITLESVHKAFSQLTPTQARRVRVQYLEKKKFCEIAREGGVNLGQISKSVQSGLKNICKCFEKLIWPVLNFLLSLASKTIILE